MKTREILITDPTINQDEHTGWSYNDIRLRNSLQRRLASAKVTPVSHPSVADLCSGKGAIASMFADLGWNPENITCIDRAVPKRLYIEGAAWRYWDLAALGETLTLDRPIPPEIRKYQHTFDVVTLYLGFIRNEEVLCNFLVREGGIVFGPTGSTDNQGIAKNVIWQF